jgi:hypothetical protein
MDVREARSALKRPLVFGDEQQIRAIRFLDEVAEAVKVITDAAECTKCNGNGRIYEYDADCEACGGKGCDECEELADCLACDGLGCFVIDWPACKDDVMKAAIAQIKSERRRQ